MVALAAFEHLELNGKCTLFLRKLILLPTCRTYTSRFVAETGTEFVTVFGYSAVFIPHGPDLWVYLESCRNLLIALICFYFTRQLGVSDQSPARFRLYKDLT